MRFLKMNLNFILLKNIVYKIWLNLLWNRGEMMNDETVTDWDFTHYFALKSLKFYKWKEQGTKRTQFNKYRNLCEELRLIKTIDNQTYVSPLGYKFIIQLQINRVREMLNFL